MSILDTSRLLSAPLPQILTLSEGVSLYTTQSSVADNIGRLGSACALGAFDGVHLGHRALIEASLEDARAQKCLSFAVTFSPDPSKVLFPERLESMLLGCEDRVRLLLSLGLDGVVVVSFTQSVSSLLYQSFFEDYLVRQLKCQRVHVGTNFRMGAGGQGTPEAMKTFGQTLGVEVFAHELETAFSHSVSATRIRSLLRAGKTQPAATLLARPHMLRGIVEHGRGQGASFGFPTANIRVPSDACLPAEGVYSGWVSVCGRVWPAAINVGAPRTFGGKVGEAFVEATLVGFEGNLYGQEVLCFYDEWLRGPQSFPTLEKLKKTVLANVDYVRTQLGEGELCD